MNVSISSYFVMVVAFVLALVLAAAAAGKLIAPSNRRAFAQLTVQHLPVWLLTAAPATARRLATVGVVAVTGSEAVIAIAVAVAPLAKQKWGLLAAAILLTAFSAIIGYSLATGRALECRCFGAKGHTYSWKHLVRNLALATAALAAWLLHDTSALQLFPAGELLMCVTLAAVIATVIVLGEILNSSVTQKAALRP
ncbi:MauE/DoxX family redox-associated membrane protein [Streptosporangium canum]|uniref:MauE/DoxX family redox-associated membrane protein n=1 Tax=Streptosporangium canum TaxID=324952 RepID=UPI00367EBEA9